MSHSVFTNRRESDTLGSKDKEGDSDREAAVEDVTDRLLQVTERLEDVAEKLQSRLDKLDVLTHA